VRRALLASLLFVAACSAPPAEQASEPLTIEATGRPGEPTLTAVEGDLSEPAVIIASEGTGPALTDDAPLLYAVSSFDDDRRLLATGEHPILTTTGEAPIDVVGVREGARVLAVNPQEGGAEILVYDILPTTITGEARPVNGSFTVRVDDNNIPVLEGTGEVDSLSTKIIIRGEGRQVASGDELYVQYSLYRAADGEKIDSTWDTGPILLDLSETFDGLRTGIAELPIVSRLLIEVPAGQAQGTDDLIVIIDILAAR